MTNAQHFPTCYEVIEWAPFATVSPKGALFGLVYVPQPLLQIPAVRIEHSMYP